MPGSSRTLASRIGAQRYSSLGVGVLQRELIQAAGALLAAEVDRRLVDHEDADARHLRQLRAQLRDDLVDAQRALGARLQIDGDAARVQAAAAWPAADVAAEARDVRILRNDRGNHLRVAHHLVEADALNGLDVDVEAALVLARQEALRDEAEQIHRAEQQRDRDRHRHHVEAQAGAQRPVVQRGARRRTSARWRCRTSRASARAAASGSGCTASASG